MMSIPPTLHASCMNLAAQFPDHIALIFDDGVTAQLLIYKELIQTVVQVTAILHQHGCPDIVVVSMDVQLHLPSILIGILETPAAFWYISPGDMSERELNRKAFQRAKFMLVDVDVLKYEWIAEDFEIVDSSDVVRSLGVVLLKSKSFTEKSVAMVTDDMPPSPAYVITTSGTTGHPKIVYVPHQSILPNIEDLSSRFAISPDDRIFLTSPLTFDPSIVEMFLALSNGAAVVMTTDAVKLDRGKLLNVFQRQGVTVLQATPTFLRRISTDQLQRTLLSDVTKLRLLVVGGEECPSWAELRGWRSAGNVTELWNIYGVTEMSCWASVHRIRECDEEEVPLGDPLSETELIVRDDNGEMVDEGEGILYLASSTRRCHIEEKVVTTPSEICTGDVVAVVTTDAVGRTADTAGRERNLYFRGRRDHQIKRNGKRIDLKGLEQVFRSQVGVDDVIVLHQANELLAFVQSRKPVRDLKLVGNERLPRHSQIDDVIVVREMPMTPHGKIDREKLAVLRHPESTTPIEYNDPSLDRLWRHYFSLETDPDPKLCFLELGGDSVGAVNFAGRVERTFGWEMPELVDLILTKSFHDLKSSVRLHSLHPTASNSNTEGRARKAKHVFTAKKRVAASIPLEDSITSVSRYNRIEAHGVKRKVARFYHELVAGRTEHGLDVELLWSHDTGKCVDASPLVIDDGESVSIYIGSHSHELVCVDGRGHVVWMARLGGRMESSACLTACGQYVVVGCYDHKVYFLNRRNGSIVWTYTTGAEVKSSPCADDVTGHVVIGSHDHHLYAFDVEQRNLSWRTDVDGSSVFSSPCICYRPHQVYTATLAGTVAAVDPHSGLVIWRHSLRKPVFSSPSYDDDMVVFGCVDHVIYTFAHSGDRLHEYRTDGPVFSSATLATSRFQSDVKESPTSSWTTRILCGSHDHHVHCFSDGQLQWKTRLDSLVYSSPFIGRILTNDEAAIFISSTRTLYILDQSGCVLHSLSLPGEVFSSPVVYDNKLFIGCRDNNIYCYKIMLK